jgi:hypothetical protein
MLSKLLFGKLYSPDFAVGYQPDVNPFTEQPVQAWDLPDIVSCCYEQGCFEKNILWMFSTVDALRFAITFKGINYLNSLNNS